MQSGDMVHLEGWGRKIRIHPNTLSHPLQAVNEKAIKQKTRNRVEVESRFSFRPPQSAAPSSPGARLRERCPQTPHLPTPAPKWHTMGFPHAPSGFGGREQVQQPKLTEQSQAPLAVWPSHRPPHQVGRGWPPVIVSSCPPWLPSFF